MTNRKRIEATQRGEQANICKARYLHGALRRRSDGPKRDGACAIPGEICMSALVLLTSEGVGMLMQKSAEAIGGVSRSRRAEHEGPRVGGGTLKEADEGGS